MNRVRIFISYCVSMLLVYSLSWNVFLYIENKELENAYFELNAYYIQVIENYFNVKSKKKNKTY